MSKISIIDIDGCILPSIFPHLTGNQQTEQEINDIVVSCNEKGKNISLYPEFIKFYKENCKNDDKVYFLTGRKESHFGSLTNLQLECLKDMNNFEIIYYPEEFVHDKDEYYHFKIVNCFRIIRNNSNSSIHVIDDMNDYFNELKKAIRLVHYNVNFFHVNDKFDWNILSIEFDMKRAISRYFGMFAEEVTGDSYKRVESEIEDFTSDLYNLLKKKYLEMGYSFICVEGCGEISLKAMKSAKHEEDPSIVCPRCGNCRFYILPPKDDPRHKIIKMR